MRSILALDEGTTSARAVVIGEDGSIRAIAQKELTQSFPQPGWVEHDAEEIWSAQMGVAVEAMSRARLSPHDLAAVGITNQRETTVLWNRKTGRPIAPAIVWQDRRTAGLCDQLRELGHEPLIRERTGLLIDAYFSGTKIAWLLEHIPGARASAEAGELAFGTIDSWLAWKLLGGKHITDVTNASRTMLFNIHTGNWDDELLHLLNVPRSLLPEVRASSEIYGEIQIPSLAGVPLAGMAGDQQAALFGQMCFTPGLTKNTYGTGCFMLQNIGETAMLSQNRLLTTVAWKMNGRTNYALEGAVFTAGAVVQWLRDGLKIIRNSEEINALAETEPDSGGVILVPAFTGLGAPHWDAYARGTIVGLSRGTTGGHIARAALECIAFQSADLLGAMSADAGQLPKEMRVDGGASQSNLLMQFQADVLGVPVIRPKMTETTALGAAYLAGLAVGYWKTTTELMQHYQVDRQFDPKMPTSKAQELQAQWARAVERAKCWANP